MSQTKGHILKVKVVRPCQKQLHAECYSMFQHPYYVWDWNLIGTLKKIELPPLNLRRIYIYPQGCQKKFIC